MIRAGDRVELTPFGVKLARDRGYHPDVLKAPVRGILREVHPGQFYVMPDQAGGLWWPARAWRAV